jgi:hypothetical protein
LDIARSRGLQPAFGFAVMQQFGENERELKPRDYMLD